MYTKCIADFSEKRGSRKHAVGCFAESADQIKIFFHKQLMNRLLQNKAIENYFN